MLSIEIIIWLYYVYHEDTIKLVEKECIQTITNFYLTTLSLPVCLIGMEITCEEESKVIWEPAPHVLYDYYYYLKVSEISNFKAKHVL